MEEYSTPQVARMFGVTEQTVKSWAAEFAQYLSPSATPEAGKKRRFMPGDIEIFALVADLRKDAQQFEAIHAALQSGQRGIVPALADELAQLNANSLIMALKNQVGALQGEMTRLQNEKSEREGQVKLLEKLLKEQLAEKDAEIRRLYRELARYEAKE